MSAQAVKIFWAESLSPGVLGYKVYSGRQSGFYTEVVDVGDVLEYTLIIDGDGNHFVAITAYDAVGESGFSAETQFFIKAVAMLLG